MYDICNIVYHRLSSISLVVLKNEHLNLHKHISNLLIILRYVKQAMKTLSKKFQFCKSQFHIYNI